MIAIVTDTSTGYTQAEATSRNVHLVPLNYVIDGKEYVESTRGNNGNFLAAMMGKTCKTSQPSFGAFTSIFSKLKDEGYDIICITLSAGLSGTFSSASRAAKEVGGNITVFDSESIAAGLTMLVDEAVNMVVGGLDYATILKHLEVIKKKINTVFTVEGLERLKSGGRLSISSAVNTTLNSRPLFACAFNIKFITSIKGVKARTIELVKNLPQNVRRVFIMRCGNVDVNDLFAALHERYPNIKIHIREVNPVVACHVGEGAFGVSYILE